jgi:hypothetical protein
VELAESVLKFKRTFVAKNKRKPTSEEFETWICNQIKAIHVRLEEERLDMLMKQQGTYGKIM